MKRIKAYSFIELMVVMVISTITIVIAYQGYILFYKQFLNFKQNSDRNAMMVKLDASLNSDVNDCLEVRKRMNSVVCIYKDKEIEYSWTDQLVLRKQFSVIDTFLIGITDVKFLNSSKEVNENELIDEIRFNGDALSFTVSKQYGADVFVNSVTNR